MGIDIMQLGYGAYNEPNLKNVKKLVSNDAKWNKISQSGICTTMTGANMHACIRAFMHIHTHTTVLHIHIHAHIITDR